MTIDNQLKIAASEKRNVALSYIFLYLVFQHIKTHKSVSESVCTVNAGLCSLSVNEKEVASAHARLTCVWEV